MKGIKQKISQVECRKLKGKRMESYGRRAAGTGKISLKKVVFLQKPKAKGRSQS